MISISIRSSNSDYKGSGFDRGHLAAAGNHKASQKHCEDTFFLTNMAPQVGVQSPLHRTNINPNNSHSHSNQQVGAGFNRGTWNRLEKHVRNLTKAYRNVYVCTGPLYLPKKEADGKAYVRYQVIGVNNVAVPTHFYKVIVGETSDGYLDMESYVLPNDVISDDTPLNVFQVRLSIEKSTNINEPYYYYITIPVGFRCRPHLLNAQLVCYFSIKLPGSN